MQFKPRDCETCGQEFLPWGSRAKFCSVGCRIFNSIDPDQSGCWNWTDTIRTDGYGHFRWLGADMAAHRAAYEAFVGPIPEGQGYHGICVCHTCDNRRCVNPSHLWLGSQSQNLTDARHKGRHARGSAIGNSRLTESQVLSIYNDSRTQQAIADQYGIAQMTVSNIKRAQTWAHVTGKEEEANENV